MTSFHTHTHLQSVSLFPSGLGARQGASSFRSRRIEAAANFYSSIFQLFLLSLTLPFTNSLSLSIFPSPSHLHTNLLSFEQLSNWPGCKRQNWIMRRWEVEMGCQRPFREQRKANQTWEGEVGGIYDCFQYVHCVCVCIYVSVYVCACVCLHYFRNAKKLLYSIQRNNHLRRKKNQILLKGSLFMLVKASQTTYY